MMFSAVTFIYYLLFIIIIYYYLSRLRMMFSAVTCIGHNYIGHNYVGHNYHA